MWGTNGRNAELLSKLRSVLVGTSRRGPTTSRRGPTTSRRGPTTSRRGPTTSRRGPTTSRRGPTTSRRGPTTSRPTSWIDTSRRTACRPPTGE